MTETTTRQERERDFHSQSYLDHRRRSVEAVYAVLHDSMLSYFGFLESHCLDKDVLEIGCGAGDHSPFIVAHGGRLTGIDISDVAVQQASDVAKNRQFSATFRVMDAEHLEFRDESFDLVCSVAILHHVDLHRAYFEIARVLRPGGHAIFMEPLGHNPAINLYRRMTPHLRTVDEHPLLMKDITLARDYFNTVDAHFCTLHSLLAVPFRKTPWFTRMVLALEGVDHAVFRIIPFLRRYAWQVVLVLSAPKRNAGQG